MDYNQVPLHVPHDSYHCSDNSAHEHWYDWLTFNAQRIEEHLLDVLFQATDLSRNTLGQWETPVTTQQEISLWYTGDIAEKGYFYCTQCHQSITLQDPGHLPTCSHCYYTTFRRASNH
ncbi:MAG TPA: hypothetical protein EYO58_07260 [Flavobacteriales bacterium]|nr:hypothetical protein [Flavobacteriales bacterium]